MEDLRDVARRARERAVIGHAVTLARWIGNGRRPVTAGPALECWPPDDADLLAGWLAGLRAICAAESYPQDEDSVRLLALALLSVLVGASSVVGGVAAAASSRYPGRPDRHRDRVSGAGNRGCGVRSRPGKSISTRGTRWPY